MNGLEGIRVGVGLASFAAPESLVGRVLEVPMGSRSRTFTRVLGARHIAQALLTGGEPTPRALRWGVVVDGVHALTMLGLAAVDPPRRRAAMLNAAAATGFAVAGAVAATRLR